MTIHIPKSLRGVLGLNKPGKAAIKADSGKIKKIQVQTSEELLKELASGNGK